MENGPPANSELQLASADGSRVAAPTEGEARFGIGFTPAEKRDLVAFLQTL